MLWVIMSIESVTDFSMVSPYTNLAAGEASGVGDMVRALRGLVGGISCSLTSEAIDVVLVSMDRVLSDLADFTSLKKGSVVGSLAVIGADVVLASWGEGASCWGRSANLGDMSS